MHTYIIGFQALKMKYGLVTIFCMVFLFHSGLHMNIISSEMEYFLYKLENCSNPGNGDVAFPDNNIINLGNNTYVLNGSLIVKTSLNNSFIVSIDIAKFFNGAWRPHYLTFDIPLCQFAETIFSSIDGLEPIFFNCPIKPGEYSMKNLQLKQHLKMKMFSPGKYKGDVTLHEGKTRVYCKVTYVEVYPIYKGN